MEDPQFMDGLWEIHLQIDDLGVPPCQENPPFFMYWGYNFFSGMHPRDHQKRFEKQWDVAI